MSARADVIVVGAGPAGAATAILLAERGLSVMVLDRARFPRPKLCGEYVSPEALRILDRLGALKALDAASAQHLAGMRITAPDGTVLVGRYRDVGRWRPYRGHALAVSREILDGVLADRLRVLPVDFREEVCATDVIVEDGAVVGVRTRGAAERAESLRAPVVIAADGRASVIAHRLGCRAPHRLRRMALATYISGVDDCRDHGEIFVDPPDYSILNPIAPDRINLSLVVPLADAARWSGRLESFFAARVKQLRHLARRVAGARLEAPVQAMGPLAYRVVAPRAGGVVLVGDAAGFYDPFTGEGIFSALRGAELAAETVARALAAGDVSTHSLGAYVRARRVAFADKAYVTRALQVIIRRRWLANLAARLLSSRPPVLDLLLGVVGDYVPARALLHPLAAE